MAEPTQLVQAIKQESSAGGGNPADEVEWLNTPINDFQDVLSTTGVALQENGGGPTRDHDVKIWRDGSVLKFRDSVTTDKTLDDLAGGSAIEYIEFLLEDDPIAVEAGSPDAAYTPTYSGINVTKEEWKRADATLIKSIDYTYSGINVTTEVRKVFATDGTTILAQVTWSHSYTGINLTGSTMVRNV